jgi:hypothetical protein
LFSKVGAFCRSKLKVNLCNAVGQLQSSHYRLFSQELETCILRGKKQGSFDPKPYDNSIARLTADRPGAVQKTPARHPLLLEDWGMPGRRPPT